MEAEVENVRRWGIYFGYAGNGEMILCVDICRRVKRVGRVKATTMVRLVASVCLGLGRVVFVLGLDDTRRDIPTSVLENEVTTFDKQ